MEKGGFEQGRNSLECSSLSLVSGSSWACQITNTQTQHITCLSLCRFMRWTSNQDLLQYETIPHATSLLKKINCSLPNTNVQWWEQEIQDSSDVTIEAYKILKRNMMDRSVLMRKLVEKHFYLVSANRKICTASKKTKPVIFDRYWRTTGEADNFWNFSPVSGSELAN